MKKFFLKGIGNYKVITALFVLFSLTAGTQSLLKKEKAYEPGGIKYNGYNNYTIFKNSFHHLREGKDLYVLYPEEQWDLYKYSPTFSAFFGVFAFFPDWLGLNLWNLFNALLLLAAVYSLPRLTRKEQGLILLICLIELMTSMQNEQSNGLMAGLLIMALGMMERGKPLWATLCIVFSVYIKIFGILGFALFLFYPQKIKSALFSLAWAVFLFVIPLLFVGFDKFEFLYGSWFTMLAQDHSASLGLSVMGWLDTWFGEGLNKQWVVLAGAVLFMVPFLRVNEYRKVQFRLLMLSSLLLWVVIFNHKAESPTFIIAMAGIALWFVMSEKNILNISLFILAFVFASLSPTDLFPRFLREEYVKPYVLKAVPCILIWLKIVYDMLRYRSEKDRILPENT